MIVIDMDMPKNCQECKFFDGEDMCYADGTYALNPSRISERPSWCPIKCDIEDIKAEIDELEIWYDNDYFSGNRDAMFKCNDVREIIDNHIKESEK